MVLDLDPRPEHVRWLSAASRVLVRTDRILSGRDDLGFTLDDYGPAPAWSDGQNVSIRTRDWERSWEDDGATARLLGLNYHELCHVMFTPRIKELRTHTLAPVFNLADDQRIETLFSALYTPAIPFFTQAVLDLIVADGQNHDTLHALVAGRKYLPRKIRRAAARAYRGDAAEWQTLIDEYLLLDWGADRARGIELIKLMAAHLDSLQVEPPEGCGTAAASRGGTADEEQDEARARVAEQMEDEEAEDEADEADDDQAPADLPEAEEDEAEADTPSTGGESEEPEADDADEAPGGTDADEDAPEADEDPAGGGGSQSPDEGDADEAEADSDPESEIDDAAAETAEVNQPLVEAEANRVAAQIELELDRPSGEMGEALPRHEERIPVTDEARVAADGLRGVLAELRAATDPGWVSHRSSGKINVGRYLRRDSWEGMDEVFDEWHPGLYDAMDLEIAILVDTSGSMGGKPALGVAEAAWALKSALGQHGLPVAVMGFDSHSTLIYGESEQADPGYMPAPLARDATFPGEVLVEAGRHFQYSTHKRRILVALTDGAWSTTHKLRPNEDAVNMADVVDSIDAELKVLLRYDGKGHQPAGFHEVHDVVNTDALVDVVREAIVEGVRRAGA